MEIDRQKTAATCKRRTLLIVFLAGMFALPMGAIAGEAPLDTPPATESPSSVVDIPIRFFQEVISPVDGPRCHSYPTCSTYARQALAEHGPFMGWIMTCDRLMRDGRDDDHRLPRIRINGSEYADDPVSANDFWWYRRQ